MVTIFFHQLFLGAALAGGIAAASPGGRARIETAKGLSERFGRVVVIDARDERLFQAGHVPGSLRVDWRDWTLERPGLLRYLTGSPARWGKVPEANETLAERLRGLGLFNSRPIVVVGSPVGWGEEGRIAWNLLYWGAEDVALLDGGYGAWTANPGHGVETGDVTRPRDRGDFLVRPIRTRRIERTELERVVRTGSRPLLDARTPEEFAGQKLPGQKRGGHVPGARLVPALSLYRPDGRFVSADELASLIRKAGSDPEAAAPVTYCTGGVRSALLALLIEARLGRVASNYDGSMWEWSADERLPLLVSPASEKN